MIYIKYTSNFIWKICKKNWKKISQNLDFTLYTIYILTIYINK